MNDWSKRLLEHFKRSRRDRLLAYLFVTFFVLFIIEWRTSNIQSLLYSHYADKLNFKLGTGPSPSIIFPEEGPFDKRRGYVRIPAFVASLEKFNYKVTRQVRFSRELMRAAREGITPPYEEKSIAGLAVIDRTGVPLYESIPRNRIFAGFEDIPEDVIKILLFVENRELLKPMDEHQNPVLEWDRMAKAGLKYVGRKIGLPTSVEGGSTLATQFQKYHHSEGGRTSGAKDKILQITSASLKVYRTGRNTAVSRREIVTDYINTVPLSSVKGYGEVYGLGEGLWAWFATDLKDVSAALSSREKSPQDEQARAEAYKKVMALFLSVKAPTNYLVKNPKLLLDRVDHFTDLMLKEGGISREFHDLIKAAPLKFRTGVFTAPRTAFIDNKASDAIRFHLLKILGLPDFYDLDRLDMTVNTTLDAETQKKVIRMLKQLGTKEYVASSGLYGDRMLKKGDPEDLIYSLVLYEKTPAGNELRVQADNMDKPFNFNEGVKLDLGSTAKLRTLVHYLMIVHETFDVLSMKDPKTLENNPSLNKDPITRWVVEQVRQNPGLTSTQIMEAAMERKFSGNPSEAFFTGGGLHRFENFNKEDNRKVMTLSEGLKNSVNLVFVRLMREIVYFHIARLGIDSKAVLDDTDHAKRMELLKIIVDKESRKELSMFAKRYRDLTPDQAVGKLLGKRNTSLRHLALLFYATHPSASAEDLDIWLRQRKPEAPGITKKAVSDLDKKYGRLTMSDYGYLLSINPVEIWTAGYLTDHPKAKWDELVRSSSGIREKTGEWLLNKRNKHAQDIRLNILLEDMAFKEIHKGWKKVGYPFEYLVPSYATSIGSSADRPVALAELMGIIMNDGISMPVIKVRSVNFAAHTPYETELFLNRVKGERVMPVEVARTARKALAGVVEGGTARRVYGAYTAPDGSPLVIGGKTGSGDNRFETFGKDGRVISSRVVNRTATFVFYIGDRYFGVITAFMPGEKAADYSFTSSLPVQIMRLLAPDLNPLVLSDTKT